MARKNYKYLSLDDRKELARLWRKGENVASIAEALGCTMATIYKELKRGYDGTTDKNLRNSYDPTLANNVFRHTLSERGRQNASGGVPRNQTRRDC
ncbi:MAG: helix-turn-helix domain-containing protein [Oscillibacter sp.]|nr:helix-turn-helix domain-containing protein [Oscillibacter sp.]